MHIGIVSSLTPSPIQTRTLKHTYQTYFSLLNETLLLQDKTIFQANKIEIEQNIELFAVVGLVQLQAKTLQHPFGITNAMDYNRKVEYL